VEDRTFICSLSRDGAGPTNNWVNPFEMRKKLKGLFDGSMRGRTMYVLAFSMGPIDSPMSQIGVQLTDSPYVVVNMRIMARIGLDVFREIDKGYQARGAVHAHGGRAARTGPGGCAVALQQREVHRALPGDARDLVVRLGLRRQRAAGQEMFRAAHCVEYRARRRLAGRAHADLGVEDPQGEKTYVAAAFPSACGKTNFAMLVPPAGFEGWKVWTIGDDIAWIKADENGRLRAINPEAGFFGVAPGTSAKTNPNAMATLRAIRSSPT
jgi:phosphoenolpyruvate carboxykinase (GTP)